MKAAKPAFAIPPSGAKYCLGVEKGHDFFFFFCNTFSIILAHRYDLPISCFILHIGTYVMQFFVTYRYLLLPSKVTCTGFP